MGQQIITSDPLIKLFKDSRLPASGYTAEAVRGEVASLQIALLVDSAVMVRLINPIVLSYNSSKLTGTIRFVGFVPVRLNTPDTPADELERSAPAFFPDPILEEEEIEIPSGQMSPIWVTIPIPQDQEPGTYRGSAALICGSRKVTCELTVIVHNARLPEKRNLRLTNWFFPHKIADYYHIDKWSEKFWEYIEAVAKDMAAHRQNLIFTPVWELLDFYRKEDKLQINFERFDRWVTLFDKYGIADVIEGSHLGARENGEWKAGYFSMYSVPVKTRDGSASRPIGGVRAGTYDFRKSLSEILPILREHLAQKGWLSRYIQHIADEPTKINAESWKIFSNTVKEFAPGIRRIEANMCSDIEGAIDIWVPLLDVYGKEKIFYNSRQKYGEEVWFYTCLIPRGKYPNRFVDMPLIKTRILHWINFRYGLTGYLHWGYNWWADDPFSDIELNQSDGTFLPPGDNAIVYPGKKGPLSSMRWDMMRKGVEDYELLLELSKKNPGLAGKMASQLVPNLTDYIRKPDEFNAARHQLINALDLLED